MNWEDHAKLLGITAEQIAAITAESFQALLERIGEGVDPRTAIESIVGAYDARYREVLAAAFSETLARFVGPDELRAYPIGDMALSQRLYRHASDTAMVVKGIVERHAAGFQDARQLTLEIFEGYGFRADEPLKISPRNPKLPKYLRREILTDPGLAGELSRHFTRAQVAAIKTPGLRSAYLEAIDAMAQGRGAKALERKLEVAYQERMRYYANRIAQTELHRAWVDKQAAEIMGDDTVEVVQFKMSGTHPRTDICDLYAHQDAYGLGPGLYPKEYAPKPPLHPHCRCGLISKRLISAKGAKENPAAGRQYLRSVMRDDGVSEAARIMGSRAKLQQALKPDVRVEDVFNTYRAPPYLLGRVGDNARMDFSSFTGQRPGLANLPPILVTELTGDEFGPGAPHRVLALAADAKLRVLQKGDGLPNADTGWRLKINKQGRKKMGDNADLSAAESKAVAGIELLAERAVVAERHADLEHGNPDVVAVFRLYAPVSVGGELYRAKLTVKDYGDPKILHALAAVEIERAQPGISPSYSRTEVLQTGQPTTGRTISITNLLIGATRNDGSPFDL